MSVKSNAGDISALLYFTPFAISGVYGLYLWVTAGISAILPSSVYLTVTRDPYVFVAGTAAVFLGLILDESSVDRAARRAKLESLGNLLQTMAMGSLILALAGALYANGFVDISGAADDFLVGKFALAFPVMLILLSYLMTAKFGLGAFRERMVLGLVAMLLVPVVIYEVGRRSAALGVGGAVVLIIAGAALFVMKGRKTDAEK